MNSCTSLWKFLEDNPIYSNGVCEVNQSIPCEHVQVTTIRLVKVSFLHIPKKQLTKTFLVCDVHGLGFVSLISLLFEKIKSTK